MDKAYTSFVSRFSRNSAFMLAGTVIANAGIFITNIILARFLSKPDYGIVVTVQYVSALFVLLMNFGIPDRTTKTVAASLGADDRAGAGAALRNAIVLLTCLFTLFAGLQTAFAGIIARTYTGAGTEAYVRLSALWGVPFFISLLGFAVVEGTQDIRWPYLLRNAYEPLKLLAAGILILASSFTVRHIFYTWTVLYLAYGAAVFLYLRRAVAAAGIRPAGPVTRAGLGATVRKSFPFFMPFVSPVLVNTLVPLMIAGVRTPAEVAAFAAILPFTSLTPLVFMAGSRALLPAVAAGFERDRASVARVAATLFRLTGLANTLIFTVLAAAGPAVITAFFGVRYASSHHILTLLLAAAFFDNFKFALDPLLKGTGRVQTVAILDYVRIAVLLALGYPAIFRFGAAGAAAVLLAISVPTVLMKLYIVRTKLGIGMWSLFLRETLLLAMAGTGAYLHLPLPVILAFTVLAAVLLKLVTRQDFISIRILVPAGTYQREKD